MTISEELREHGYCLTSGAKLGWPSPLRVINAFSPALVPDPRGPGKQHARDVIRYWLTGLTGMKEADSIAFTTDSGEVIDDFSRFRLLEEEFGFEVVSDVIVVIPEEDWHDEGMLSADYFRYSAGVESAAHRDGFGEYVVIWVLGRTGQGGESFLLQDGREVFSRALEPGEVLIFRDELFLHGVRAVTGPGAIRDVLIFITVKP